MKTKIPSKKVLMLFCAAVLFGDVFNAQAGFVRLSEIMYDPEGSDEKKEWVEVFSEGPSLSLQNWSLVESNSDHRLNLVQGSWNLADGEYAVIADNSDEFIKAYPDYGGTLFDSSFSLSNSGEKISLKNQDNAIIFNLEYTSSLGASGNGRTLVNNEDSWNESDCVGGSPGKEKCASENDNEDQNDEIDDPDWADEICASDKIFLNELYSYPDEYVELYNAGNKCNLKGWSITDELGFDPEDLELANRNWNYHRTEIKEDLSIETEGLVLVEGELELNNTDDIAKLFDAGKSKVQQVAYEKGKNGTSYNFDGTRWRWSKSMTPGEKNIFNNVPDQRISIEKNIYKNVYANFEAYVSDEDGDEVSVTWDFGDNHKSYKTKTRHKYEKTGKYDVIVKIFDGSEEVVENKTIEVKSFPKPKIKIVAVNPNPEGKDGENEYITLLSKFKRELNLKGWSIATGSNSKKLSNHPIITDFTLKPGNEKQITNEYSKFSLGNEKSKIELRYPDGKVADSLKYKKEKISEGEIYQKTEKGWVWKVDEIDKQKENKKQEAIIQPIKASPNVESENEKTEPINSEFEIEQEVLAIEYFLNEFELMYLQDELEKIENDLDENKRVEKQEGERIKNEIEGIKKILADRTNLLSKVFNGKTLETKDGEYKFTQEQAEGPHYISKFIRNFNNSFNSSINSILNQI